MRDRTADLLRAKQALSQLSYSPFFQPFLVRVKFIPIKANSREVCLQHMSGDSTQSGINLVGLGRLELPTSPLSGVRSNQLSYRPMFQSQTSS